MLAPRRAGRAGNKRRERLCVLRLFAGGFARRGFSCGLRPCATGGGFYFFNESLDGITAQLARCFDQKIIITDPELAGVRFYAFFTNNESLLKILGTLNTDKSMSIRERNDVIYISRKK